MKATDICIATIEGGVVCHQEVGREAARTTIPVLSAIEVAAAHCAKRSYKRVGVLGTAPTMKRRLLDCALGGRGIETAYPSASDRDASMQIISDELIRGIFLDSTWERLEKMAQALSGSIFHPCSALIWYFSAAKLRRLVGQTERE